MSVSKALYLKIDCENKESKSLASVIIDDLAIYICLVYNKARTTESIRDVTELKISSGYVYARNRLNSDACYQRKEEY